MFNQYPDPTDNYARLFIDETEDETIYAKIWLPYEKGHSYDLRTTPYSYRVDWGACMSPTKQLLDSYEVLSTGLLPSESGSGFDENNPFENRDPRLKGTILMRLDIGQVFTLTYQAPFFRKLHFTDIDKRDLPHKVWSDCLNCPQFPDCDEEAMIWLANKK